MFRNDRYFRRRVFAQNSHGVYSARIERQNAKAFYVWWACLWTVGFGLFADMVIGAIRNHPRDATFILPILVIALVGYAITLLIAVWGAFGIEEIVVETDSLRWNRIALKWKRTIVIPLRDITDIQAVTPWHALENHVEVITSRRHHAIGEKLLRDEAIELAQQLRKVVGVTR